MKLMQFWSDLTMWNKFGLSFVAAVIIIFVVMLAVS